MRSTAINHALWSRGDARNPVILDSRISVEAVLSRKTTALYVDASQDTDWNPDESGPVGRLHVSLYPVELKLRDKQHWSRYCAEDLQKARDRHPELAVVGRVTFSHTELPKQGIGTRMYEAALQSLPAGTLALAPDSCGHGSTSHDALRRWADLKRRWVSVGDLVVNLPI